MTPKCIAAVALAALLGGRAGALSAGRRRSACGAGNASERQPPCLRVLAFDRPSSLSRLLTQLNMLEYGEDFGSIDLEISIDFPAPNSTEEVLKTRQVSVKLAEDFAFEAGCKTVRNHAQHRGLVRQWLDAWSPERDGREACLVLEDDTLPSIHAWRWMQGALRTYRGSHHLLGSLALQRQTTVVSLAARKGPMPPQTGCQPYLYKLFATWGYIALRQSWSGFREWMMTNYKHGHCPVVLHQGQPIMPTVWCHQKPGSVWSVWFIKYMDDRGLYSLYANLPNDRTLCSNYREPGLHFSPHAKTGADFLVLEGLTPEAKATLLSFPPLQDLAAFDYDAGKIRANLSRTE